MSAVRGSEVWLKADLAGILRALVVASVSAERAGAHPEYIAGQQATMLMVATALGIEPHLLQLPEAYGHATLR
jgi:ABC-type sulfate/molybdate transport systems ATPase subunit